LGESRAPRCSQTITWCATHLTGAGSARGAAQTFALAGPPNPCACER
jgi:hypothetical protein